MTSKEDVNESLRSIGIREMSDLKKIEFLVSRKFPGYNHPPELFITSSILGSRTRPSVQKAHKEIFEQGNEYKEQLEAKSREELLVLYQQECEIASAERQKSENDLFFNQSNAGADASWKYAALVTIEEAIALDFNKNPEIVNWKSVKPYVNVSPFAKRYKQLRNLAIRAVAAEILSDPVIPKDFKKWREPLKYELSDVLADLLKESKDDTTESTLKTEQETDNETTKALPPRALTGIAKMFPIDREEEKNEEKWKKFAAGATRNGLICARISTSGGSGKSVFDPWLVGDWLVAKSHMLRAEVNRRMAANFEPGYEYLKDTLLS